MSDNGPFPPTAKFEQEKDSVPIQDGTAANGESRMVPAADPVLSKVPERIGRYCIERVLGAGGFGVVYLAHDEQLERPVAVKVPHANRILRPEDAAQYLAEARLVAGLTHPHIVPVYDVGSTDQFPCYVVSKYIDGSTLAQKINQARPVPSATADLVANVAEALHYAHKQRIVHRDVKPGNILIDSTGQPFVVDFGLALREQEARDAHRYAGTPAYMSPEQARGEGHRVDGRSDIFSLGVILYEMLVGSRPFHADTQQELLELVTTVEPKPPRQINDQIPKELERICLKALSKRATDRYTTAKDLADDLRHWINNLDGGRIAAKVGLEPVEPVDEPEMAATPGLSKHAFLSYAAPDKEAAYQLCRLLEEQGIGCWIAPRDVAPGANYGEAVIRAIEATPATVLLLSPHSNASIHVAHEVERATSKRKRVIPVRLEDVRPSQSLELHLASAHWLDAWRLPPERVAAQLALVLRGKELATPFSLAGTPPTPASDTRPIRIVPKGLRSFDEHDADFFVELLPGPRDRDGLPDSIRFWKTRIEEADVDKTFSVGLIYGPSGCGKSSLVKAGLLPRLSDRVIAIYVDATAEETETRLLNGLRKCCPALSDNLSLKETLAALRRGQGIAVGKKVVIVLDQFEQWLHAKTEERNTELVEALRQCDGGRVQCIVMVRDDFWLAVSRFMRELENRLVEGQNSALVDLFDLDHARKVLAAFGQAFGKLPESSGDTIKDQKEFLNQAVSGLAQEGKVICVRMALFAEMMKGKAWTPGMLKQAGGTEGVGITFLEETFSASTAPPEHRLHQKAARAVLKALLPEAGANIRGHMRSYAELADASGYASRLSDFNGLMRILDGELRLITPTDPEGNETAAGPTSGSTTEPGLQYYQLTHDYLVPSLGEWLTRKQKETRRGRAELQLAALAAFWNIKPENRRLPTLREYLNIRLFTQKLHWTEPHRQMMRKARRVHGIRTFAVLWFLLGSIVILLLPTGYEETEARREVQFLLSAQTADIKTHLGWRFDTYRQWANPIMRKIVDNEQSDSKERLHSSLALLKDDPSQVTYLVDRLLTATPEQVAVIRTFLLLHKSELLQQLWQTASEGSIGQRLRAAAALAEYDSHNSRWKELSPDVVSAFVSVPTSEAKCFISQMMSQCSCV